jgi:hypothetical protein
MTVLPDILVPNLHIIFCGTAVVNVSAQRGAYYAGPGNMFWPTLHAVGLTSRRLQPEAYREVLSFGLGLTDSVRMSMLWTCFCDMSTAWTCSMQTWFNASSAVGGHGRQDDGGSARKVEHRKCTSYIATSNISLIARH